MSTTPAEPAETGPEPLDQVDVPTRAPGPAGSIAAGPGAAELARTAAGPAAAELARTAARQAGELLAPPAPVRLGDVVPVPEQVTPDPAADFTLPADAVIRVTADQAARDVADQLADLLRPATGLPLPVATEASAHHATPAPLTLTLAGVAAHDGSGQKSAPDQAESRQGLGRPDGRASGAGLGAEGYRLDVTTDGVRITADTAAGLFHGVQTLRQLLPAAVESPAPAPARWVLPGGTIVDRPRFAYRGAMLDVARHFFAVADVLRVVDHLARYKLNHLHLHLTDDQGWRIAVDSWPRLAEVGGATEVGGGPGGHYTKADYRRIVAYAARRHVTVVPEIDLPGHTNAALVAYPELAPGKIPPPPYTGTEVGFSHVDPADERTYDFVADVVGEVAALTPGPWLHLGGDEAFKVKGEAYTGFVERAQRIVAATGKTVVGWHQLAPAAPVAGRVLQWWGTNGDDPDTATAVRRGDRLILSPGNHAYLDMKYAPDTPIGHDWAGLIDVRRAYDWDPGTHLTGVPVEAVLGVEAPLWTESVGTLAEVEFMLFPRLPALAELGWSPRSTHDWADFRERLAAHGPRWTIAGITFHPSPEVPWPAAARFRPVPTQPAPPDEAADPTRSTTIPHGA